MYYKPMGKVEFELLYDFGLQTGSVFPTYGDGAEFKMTGKDEVVQGGVTYARQYMSVDVLTVFKWVEGVGSEVGLTHDGANGLISGSSYYFLYMARRADLRYGLW